MLELKLSVTVHAPVRIHIHRGGEPRSMMERKRGRRRPQKRLSRAKSEEIKVQKSKYWNSQGLFLLEKLKKKINSIILGLISAYNCMSEEPKCSQYFRYLYIQKVIFTPFCMIESLLACP